MHSKETIEFDITLGTTFWELPASVSIYINDIHQCGQKLTTKFTNFKFTHSLEFSKHHKLKIIRTGKTDDQTPSNPKNIDKIDQMVWLEKLKIDGIDVSNIIWTSSYYYPIFPEPWHSEQISHGVNLEYPVLSGTWWGHNGHWELDFYSPFYKFLIDRMQ